MRSYRYIIIGNSAAGIATVEGIRKRDREGSIAIISQEDGGIYSRPMLSHYLSGKIPEEKLNFRQEDFYTRNGAETFLGRCLIKVDPVKNRAILTDGEELTFEKVMIAAGAHAKRHEMPGGTLKNVFTLHNRKDAKEIGAAAAPGMRAVVLGGGPVGMGAIQALRTRGLDVTIIISSGRLMSQLLDDEGSEIVRERIERNGIKVQFNSTAVEILGKDRVTGLRLDDGSEVPSDLVVFCKGVVPNIGLVKGTDIDVRQGIVVNSRMCTNIPNVYAAGDVAEALDILSGGWSSHSIWPNATEQGRIAGENMAGGEVDYPGAIAMNSVNVFGLPMMVMGSVRPKDRDGVSFMRSGSGEQYKCITLKGDRIIGTLLVGKVSNAGIYSMLIKRKMDISKVRGILLSDDFDRGKLIDQGVIDENDAI
ncbi:MAG TPA: FAD-dependent oxidoreductase [Methanomassiliicoccales archaeon]|jgi:NAD(P)H-nitrite reductase large subunit